MVVAVAVRPKQRLAVCRAFLVDGVSVVEAVVTADALELVIFLGGAKLRCLVAVVMAIARAARGRDTVCRTAVVNGHLVGGAVLARDAGVTELVVKVIMSDLKLVVECLLFGTELCSWVAFCVMAARGSSCRDAVLRALVVDRVTAPVAVLARKTLVFVTFEVRAEFSGVRNPTTAMVMAIALGSRRRNARVRTLFVDRKVVSAVVTRGTHILEMPLVAAELFPFGTVRVFVAVCAKLRDAVGGALVVDRILVLVAVLAANARVLMSCRCRAELSLHVAVRVCVASSAHRRDTVGGASMVDRVCVLAAVAAADTLVLVAGKC
jgi:hypothetical protein